MKAQRAAILLGLLLAGCGEPATLNQADDGSTTPPYVRSESEPSMFSNLVQPVRIGEQGPSFAACNGRGAIRDRANAGPVSVRAAPFDQAAAIDQLAPRSEFFICSRSTDQRWFGIVYDGGASGADCGVSRPVPSRRDYDGPCASGWVASAAVKLVGR